MSKKEKVEAMDETDEVMSKEEMMEGNNSSEDISDQEILDKETEETYEERLEAEVAKEKDKFLRLFAEFENYKKRTSKERVDLFKTAGQEVIVSLLPVLDDFERALNELSKSSDKELFTGVKLIYHKFSETLKAKGLEEIKTKEGDSFDAEIHDAITQIPAPTKKLKGKIIDVVEKGFRLGDKIIRHPKVVVGN